MSNTATKTGDGMLSPNSLNLNNHKVVGSYEDNSTVIDLDFNTAPEEIKLAQFDQRFLDILPKNIAGFIREHAKADSQPIGCYLNPIIATFAQAAGDKFELKWREYVNRTNVYLLTVGKPSSGKSRGEQVILTEVRKKDKELSQQSDNIKHAFIPASTSHQALQAALIDSGSILFSCGELVNLIGHLKDKQGDGQAWLGLLLELYTSTSIKRVFRGDGTSRTETAILSVLANTQPKNFIQFTAFQGDGLSQRFLIWPLINRKKARISVQHRAAELIDPIKAKLRAIYEFGSGDTYRFNLEDDKQAEQAYVDYYNKMSDIEESSSDELEKELIGKDRINFLKLILILHLMYNADSDYPLESEITAGVVHKAYALLELYREAYLWTYDYCSGLTTKGEKKKVDTKLLCYQLLQLKPNLNQSQIAQALGIQRTYFSQSQNHYLKSND
jgi:hypothetical protein